jgi:hypothetical protein
MSKYSALRIAQQAALDNGSRVTPRRAQLQVLRIFRYARGTLQAEKLFNADVLGEFEQGIEMLVLA